jgi:hypothetical protein
MFCRNPRTPYCYPYHPSDWVFFGCREDLLDLWDIPLQPEPETSRWYELHPSPRRRASTNLARFTPEQYVWVSFLRKHGRLQFEHCHDFGENALELTELTFANNLVLLEPWQYQIRFLKYPIRLHDWLGRYTHGDWLAMYRRYCDPSFRIPRDPGRIGRLALYYAYLRPRWWAFEFKKWLLRRQVRRLPRNTLDGQAAPDERRR